MPGGFSAAASAAPFTTLGWSTTPCRGSGPNGQAESSSPQRSSEMKRCFLATSCLLGVLAGGRPRALPIAFTHALHELMYRCRCAAGVIGFLWSLRQCLLQMIAEICAARGAVDRKEGSDDAPLMFAENMTA